MKDFAAKQNLGGRAPSGEEPKPPLNEGDLQRENAELRRQVAHFQAISQSLSDSEHRLLEQRVAERTDELARSNRALQAEIEERTRAEAALRLREDELRVAIDTIPGLVWTSAPDGRIEYLNKRWLDYTGLRQEEAAGWGWQVAIHPDDLPGLVAYWKSILAAGEAGQHEARLRRFDGEFRWFLFRSVPLRDAAEKVVRWYGTNTDIEAMRASEQLARGQVEALRQILSGLSTESEPEKFFEHVLRTMVHLLGAEGIGAWELNPQTEQVEFVGSYEDGVLRLPGQTAGVEASQFLPAPREHPVWSEFFRSGAYCIIGDLRPDGVYVRAAERPNTPWYPYLSAAVAHPGLPAMIERLKAKGIVTTLCAPTFVSGRVTGFLSIRFQQRREFQCCEIELARALAHQTMLAIRLMRLSGQSRRAAVAAERNRMARDIHDTLAQGFTGVIMQLQAAKGAAARSELADAATHIERAEELARSSLGEARRSMRALRPRSLNDGTLCMALADLLERVSSGANLKAEFHLEGEHRLIPLDWEEGLLRITQESLTNTIKHAQARTFRATLTFEPAQIRLQLIDDGRGFDPQLEHDGLGLLGMKERVDQMGGLFTVRSQPGRPTEILITLEHPHPSRGAGEIEYA